MKLLFKKSIIVYILFAFFFGCKKKDTPIAPTPTPAPASFSLNSLKVNGAYNGFTYYNVNPKPSVLFSFTAPLSNSSLANSIQLVGSSGVVIPINTTLQNNDSAVLIQPLNNINPITLYTLKVSTALQSKAGGNLQSPVSVKLTTAIDSTDKFSQIADTALLTLIQQQTFRYFWDFGHPVSGMARERNTSGDVVTTGGTGFGIMSMLAGINRGFISRTDGLNRINTIVSFLTNNCTRYHGAFAHWINGATGATVPFSTRDNGADLVETSFLIQGLLCARQYFNGTNTQEVNLRNNINTLWDGVEWNWFTQNNQQVLYWHWSPNYTWAINMPIKGWNEALITYILAASSTTSPISQAVYTNGWASNGGMKNGNTYYENVLPLGPTLGGPLFFAHYSFLGINPNNLNDAYANYMAQNTAHAKINYAYCVANPAGYNGYSSSVWGLTASDDNVSGYSAHSPTNDVGVVSPTAAIASLPYTPTESMAAIRFFYYKLGDKIWGQYGFTDAFNLTNIWFAGSYLAIDQGPEIIMIENYRSGLLWNLFTSCPEVQQGMRNLGFTAPYL
ncbi:glucoamylase family protein [Hydrotalea sp.]|uniref:glucoamylase family protein n=1 Tax=Hydrotalea sp. TaxID=2881279 RepID=UPI00261791F0|nr:glucoamylase family protein [Hydrotalea sp.]